MLPTPTSTANRRSLPLTAGAAILLVLAGGFASYVRSPSARQAVVLQADNLLDMLEDRSPGSRQVGELTKLKAERPQLPADLVPEERALGKVFGVPPTTALEEGLAPPGYPLFDEGVTFGVPPALPFSHFPPAGVGGGPIFNPPASGNLTPPPIGGGVIAAPTVNPVTPTPEAPAVPEPSTWSVLIAGLAMCAAAMRRRRKLSGPESAARCA